MDREPKVHRSTSRRGSCSSHAETEKEKLKGEEEGKKANLIRVERDSEFSSRSWQ